MNGSTGICVALVDDDESVCRSLGRVLRASGIEAIAFHSAEDFLADADRSRFDCLLLDIQLGGLSGIELSQRLAAEGSTSPVIFITAFSVPDVHEQALRTPGVAYLRKCEPARSVLDAIAEAVAARDTGSDPNRPPRLPSLPPIKRTDIPGDVGTNPAPVRNAGRGCNRITS